MLCKMSEVAWPGFFLSEISPERSLGGHDLSGVTFLVQETVVCSRQIRRNCSTDILVEHRHFSSRS